MEAVLPEGERGRPMRVEEYFKGEETAVRHCPTRATCPMGTLCGTVLKEGQAPLYPMMAQVEPGGLVWVDLRYEQRVLGIRDGVFACITDLTQENESPFSLCGAGNVTGLAELYIQREFTSTYYLRALTPATVCSFSAKALRHRLESLASASSHKILSCTLMNLVAAAYSQSRVMANMRLSDRICALLVRLKELLERDGGGVRPVSLTHGDIAALVASDRASVTRALHKVEQDGYIELGYRTLTLTDKVSELAVSHPDVQTAFHVPALVE